MDHTIQSNNVIILSLPSNRCEGSNFLFLSPPLSSVLLASWCWASLHLCLQVFLIYCKTCERKENTEMGLHWSLFKNMHYSLIGDLIIRCECVQGVHGPGMDKWWWDSLTLGISIKIKHRRITIPPRSVCVCVSVGVKTEVLLCYFPSDLHSNALLPLTDEAGNGYCQCEASLL